MQNLCKTYAKPLQNLCKTCSQPRTELTGQNKTKYSHSPPGRSHMYCTVRAVWQRISRSLKLFQTQTPNSILFQGLELSFWNSKTFPNIPKPVRTLINAERTLKEKFSNNALPRGMRNTETIPNLQSTIGTKRTRVKIIPLNGQYVRRPCITPVNLRGVTSASLRSFAFPMPTSSGY